MSPLAVALEALEQGWALLVVQQLLDGSRDVETLVAAIPTMDAARIGATMQTLCRAGLVRLAADTGGGVRYMLTDLARGLAPAVDALAAWGTLLAKTGLPTQTVADTPG